MQFIARSTVNCSCYLVWLHQVRVTDEGRYFTRIVFAVMQVVMRGALAVSVCTYLYLALSPQTSPWHVPWLSKFLGWDAWKPLAQISYAVNMMHLRVILEISFRWFKPSTPEDITFSHVLALFFTSFAVVVVLAKGMSVLETPLRARLHWLLVQAHFTNSCVRVVPKP